MRYNNQYYHSLKDRFWSLLKNKAIKLIITKKNIYKNS